jgi:lipoprotein NlpD
MMNRRPYLWRFFSAGMLALLVAGCVSNSPAPVEHRSQTLSGMAAPAMDGPGYHTVKKGETLYGIALEYGQDYREIAAWNYIVNPNAIAEGQVLRVLPPESPTAAAAPIVTGAVVEQRSLDDGTSLSTNTPTLKREPRVNKEPYSEAAYLRAQNAPAQVATPQTVAPQAAKPVEPPPPAKTTAPVLAATSAPAATTVSGLSWSWPASGKSIGNFSQTKGIDIAGKAGDPVLAAAAGRVVYVGSSLRGYGLLVIIKHNTNYLSAYAHNRRALVEEGQEVQRGAKIAEMGNTDSDTVKLHFEVRHQGKPVDPLNFLPRQ